MIDIGVLGLDTSHAEAFADVLREREPGRGASGSPEATIGAVWDGGTVRDDTYVTEFCEEWGATRYDEPAAMVNEVDAAMVLTVDWTQHRSLAVPFLEAGVPTLVDKPVAGSVDDLDALAAAAESVPLFGGSAVPFHPAFDRLSDDGTERTLHVAGYNDYFYYRTHVVDTARRLAGADWTRVSPIEATRTTTVAVSYADGTWGTLRFDAPAADPAYAALAVGETTSAADVLVDEDSLQRMYEGYLEAFLRFVDGKRPDPTRSVIDSARLLLAVEVALAEERAVSRGDPAVAAMAPSTESFLEDYEPYY